MLDAFKKRGAGDGGKRLNTLTTLSTDVDSRMQE